MRGWERSGQAAFNGLVLYVLSLVPGLVLFCAMVTVIPLVGIGVGLALVPLVAAKLRRYTDFQRWLIGRWTGTAIDSPHLDAPRRPAGRTSWWQDTVDVLSDPATWRDLGWLLANPVVAAFTAFLPAAFILEGVYGVLLAAGLWVPIHDEIGTEWYTFVPVSNWATAAAAGVLGLVYFAIGMRIARPLLRAHGVWSARLLEPTEKARLAQRVRRLTESRSDALDAQAAELRRIERDLHDGAQARLVAMGMSLGAIEHLLERDPARTRELLAAARADSARALAELRDLVRGIHPPVLADRGLVDAIRALALDHPLPVEVTAETTGRLDPPVESAAYFATSELLTNVAKHAGARQAWVDVRHGNGALRISVTDDGRGGASPDGDGLRGVERRIGAFDGILAVSSPPGGPTIVTLEIPCASSSPKTSLS